MEPKCVGQVTTEQNPRLNSLMAILLGEPFMLFKQRYNTVRYNTVRVSFLLLCLYRSRQCWASIFILLYLKHRFPFLCPQKSLVIATIQAVERGKEDKVKDKTWKLYTPLLAHMSLIRIQSQSLVAREARNCHLQFEGLEPSENLVGGSISERRSNRYWQMANSLC